MSVKGRETTGAREGQKVITDQPVDKSSYGQMGNKTQKMGGGLSDLSHSLSGASAHQGVDPGRKSKIS